MKNINKYRFLWLTWMIFTVASMAQARSTVFTPAADYATNESPFFVKTGDFKNDGRLDISVANRNDSNVSVLLNSVSVPTSPAPPPGLISWWRGEGNALDSVGTNHGTLQGNVQYTSGKIGQGFKFQDYFNEKVRVESQVYEMSGGTVSLWFNWDGSDSVCCGNVMIGSEQGGDTRSPTLWLSAGELLWEFGSLFRMRTFVQPIPGRWYHAALTYDSNYNVKVYVDGILVSGATSVNPGDFLDRIDIGNQARAGGNGVGFGGILDEVQIYNRPLSDCEVAGLHDTSNGCDNVAPTTLSLTNPTANSAGWNNTDVNLSLSTTDNSDGAGVKNITYSASGAQIISPTTVTGSAANLIITAEGETTINYFAEDNAGNVESAQAFTVRVDKTAPTISLGSPTAGNYLLNQAVTVSLNCSDALSGVASCTGTTANGGMLDTLSIGTKTFAVNATDIAGNSASSTINYNVVFGLEVLFDQTKAHKSGSTVPIKIRLVDANGANVSSAATVVHAVNVIQLSSQASTSLDDAGNSNPDFDFRYDESLAGYIFNLKTTGYGTGTYQLNFTAGNSPTMNSVQFQVRQ